METEFGSGSVLVGRYRKAVSLGICPSVSELFAPPLFEAGPLRPIFIPHAGAAEVPSPDSCCASSRLTRRSFLFQLIVEQIQGLLISFGRSLNCEHPLASVIVRPLGNVDLAAAQATDLGNVRPHAPDSSQEDDRVVVRRCSGCTTAIYSGDGRDRVITSHTRMA